MATITQMTSAASSIYRSLYAGNSRTDATRAIFGGPMQRQGNSSLYAAQYRGQDSSADELSSILAIANQDGNMKDLRKAARAVENTDFKFSRSDITTNADGSRSYSDRLKSAISDVKDLVSKYNETSDFLRENKELGKGVQALSSEFSDTIYMAGSYAKMGISVDGATGKLRVNENLLADALIDSPARSEAILGRGGLAGRADRHAEAAQFSRRSVIPTMEQAIGGQLSYASNILNGRSLPTMSRYSNMLNLFSIYV